MSRRISFVVMAAMSALVAAPVLAQTMTSPSTPPRVGGTDRTTVTGGTNYVTADQQLRASKLIGSSVYNDQQQKIGSIDELLVDKNHDVTAAVLSVGGFLGMGAKLVKVPYDQLHVVNDTIVMSGASKEQLTSMPDYKYASAT